MHIIYQEVFINNTDDTDELTILIYIHTGCACGLITKRIRLESHDFMEQNQSPRMHRVPPLPSTHL